jgi:uncharacterized protein (DUF305 family)
MNLPAKLIAGLGASGLAGAMVAAVVLAITFTADSRSARGASHDHAGAFSMCVAASAASQPSFYSDMTEVNSRMHEAMEIVPSGDVDHDFVRMMIPHHQGAIDMALVLLKYGRDERLKRLAQSIVVEQGQEIAYMHTLFGSSPAEASTLHHSADQ